jgi:hypothetical protein
MELTVRRCGNCGENKLSEVELKDIWINESWKDFPRIFLSQGVTQLQCQHCHEFAGTRATARAFDDAVRQSIQEQTQYFIEKILKKSRLRLTDLAERLSIGYQHISDLKNRRAFPSFHYWSLLYRFANDPDLLDRFKDRLDQKPPMSRLG